MFDEDICANYYEYNSSFLKYRIYFLNRTKCSINRFSGFRSKYSRYKFLSPFDGSCELPLSSDLEYDITETSITLDLFSWYESQSFEWYGDLGESCWCESCDLCEIDTLHALLRCLQKIYKNHKFMYWETTEYTIKFSLHLIFHLCEEKKKLKRFAQRVHKKKLLSASSCCSTGPLLVRWIEVHRSFSELTSSLWSESRNFLDNWWEFWSFRIYCLISFFFEDFFIGILCHMRWVIIVDILVGKNFL